MSNKREEMLKLREQGLTYQQIADTLGVSRQYVGAVCVSSTPRSFQYVSEKGCIYPNLREWMNENKISRAELVRRMGLLNSPSHYSTLLGIYMRGQADPPKWFIDKLLKATGMTYEKLFYKEATEA